MKQLYITITFLLALVSMDANAQCTPPAVTGTTAPTEAICSGTSATLSATSDGGTLAWFTSQTGGTAVGTGSTFETPPLAATASYWVEAQGELTLGTPQSGGGKLAPTSSSSATVNTVTNPWGLQFTATEGFILNSVDVFLSSGTPGTIVLQLKDSNWALLETINVDAPAGGTGSNPVQFTVPVNLTIAPGSYKLVVDSGPAMIRDTGTNAFPFAIGTVGSITAGTINDANNNSGVYYFLYNWNFTPYVPCASARQEVVVNVNPAPPGPEASAQSFCGTATVANLEATGTGLKWYAGPTITTELAADTALSTGTYYVSQMIDGCESLRTSVSVSVNPIPDAPTATAQSFCSSGTVAQLTAGGLNLQWYGGETDDTPLTGDTALTTGTYYVSQTAGACESARTAVEVTIVTPPAAPTAQAQSFCGEATVAQLTANGDNLLWYTTETASNSLTADTPLFSITYYVSQTVSGCESERAPVEVTVNAIPDAPLANANVLCGSATVAQLTATGDNMQWYADETGGSPLTDGTPVTEGTYYVSQTIEGCESSRTPVTVTINSVPEPPAIEFISLCNTSSIDGFEGEGELLWYANATGGTPLGEEETLVTGTYYISQIVNGCESARAEVAVNIEIVTEPEADPVQQFSTGETLADLDVIGVNLIWYAADGVTPLDSSTLLEDGATYWVSQTINGCESSKTQITVTESLSVNERLLSGLKVFPNPVTDKVTVSYSSPINSITVYNLLGQKLSVDKTAATDVVLDFSALSAGTYILKIASGEATNSVKILKK